MAVAVSALTVAAKYGVPQFSENGDFDQWENEMEMWKMITELPPIKQGPVTYLSLSNKVKTQCGLKKEDLAQDDGLEKLIMKLRAICVIQRAIDVCCLREI